MSFVLVKIIDKLNQFAHVTSSRTICNGASVNFLNLLLQFLQIEIVNVPHSLVPRRREGEKGKREKKKKKKKKEREEKKKKRREREKEAANQQTVTHLGRPMQTNSVHKKHAGVGAPAVHSHRSVRVQRRCGLLAGLGGPRHWRALSRRHTL